MANAPLLTSSEMGALRQVAEQGMADSVDVYRQTVTAGSYGDDVSQFTYLLTTKGWVYSVTTPNTPIQDESGRQVTVMSFWLRVPVGTDLELGDRVVIDGRRFTVTDMDEESTWLPMVSCALRRLE